MVVRTKKSAAEWPRFQERRWNSYCLAALRRRAFAAPIRPLPSRTSDVGSGTADGGGGGGAPGAVDVPTSEPTGCGTAWNLTKMKSAICCSVNPVKPAPVTENDADSVGDIPSF